MARRYRTILEPGADAPRRVLVATHNGEEGFWTRFTQSCSGCFEPGECMGLAHHYPYDSKAGCHIGAGCDECGYTGKRRTSFFVSFALFGIRTAAPASAGTGEEG